MITIGEGVLTDALEILHECGEESHECVLLLSGPLDRPGVVDVALHPEHTSGPGGYEIDPKWMHRLWTALAETGRAVRAQIHTHPRLAFHSRCDDDYPAVHTSGFVSLVVPHFARPPVEFGEVHASVLERGGWRRSTLMQEVHLV